MRIETSKALLRLPPSIATKQQKEKDEVLGKLKDLGNTVLGTPNSCSHGAGAD